MKSEYQQLQQLLERRIAVISNHSLRDSNPDEQLKQLQEVSEAINQLHQNIASDAPPRLKHFLENCSYDKALDWLKNNPVK